LDIKRLQCDLNLVGDRADKWPLRFNVEKCKTMHLGGASQEIRVTYEMKSTNGQLPQILEETNERKDLGVVISNNLKASAHIAAAVNKANKILGLIRRSFTFTLMKQLYTSLVRPNLEFGNVIWNPCLKEEMDLLERAQLIVPH